MAHITAIHDHGTIVEVVLSDGDRAMFDHSPFRWMCEARRGDLRGECRLLDSVEGPVLLFDDSDDMLTGEEA